MLIKDRAPELLDTFFVNGAGEIVILVTRPDVREVLLVGDFYGEQEADKAAVCDGWVFEEFLRVHDRKRVFNNEVCRVRTRLKLRR